MISELAEIDTLPGTHVESAVSDRNSKTYSKERALGMRRHVVGALHGVGVVWLILLDDMVPDTAEVGTYVGIGTLIYRKCA